MLTPVKMGAKIKKDSNLKACAYFGVPNSYTELLVVAPQQ